MSRPNAGRRRWLMAGAGSLAATAGGMARAALEAAYPLRPIRLLVPYSAGSGADIAARGIARALAGPLGKELVVENQPGGAAIPASLAVARAVPDGYTLLLAATQHAINPALGAPLPYDPLASFAPIGRISSQPLMLAASSTLGVGSVAELVAAARARPGSLNYASTGVGTSIHLAGAYFAHSARIDVRHVPYRNAADALSDLARGDVHFIFYPYLSVLAQVRSGRLRLLASSAAARSAWAAQIPTLAESGYPECVLPAWQGLLGPAQLPPAVVGTLQTALGRVLKDPAVIAGFAASGTDVFPAGPSEFSAFLASEIARYREIVRISGAQAS